jgi:hypothetical protein
VCGDFLLPKKSTPQFTKHLTINGKKGKITAITPFKNYFLIKTRIR